MPPQNEVYYLYKLLVADHCDFTTIQSVYHLQTILSGYRIANGNVQLECPDEHL